MQYTNTDRLRSDMMNSLFPDICTDNLTASKVFYKDLLDLETLFEIDWYV